MARPLRINMAGGREQPRLRSLERRATWNQIGGIVEGLKHEPWGQFRDRHGDWGGDLVLWLAWKQGGLTRKPLGEKAGGIDSTSVSTALKRFRDRGHHDRKLTAITHQVQAQLPNAKT